MGERRTRTKRKRKMGERAIVREERTRERARAQTEPAQERSIRRQGSQWELVACGAWETRPRLLSCRGRRHRHPTRACLEIASVVPVGQQDMFRSESDPLKRDWGSACISEKGSEGWERHLARAWTSMDSKRRPSLRDLDRARIDRLPLPASPCPLCLGRAWTDDVRDRDLRWWVAENRECRCGAVDRLEARPLEWNAAAGPGR